MAVEVVYRSSRDPERLFMDKAEADRYDKMLELAEALAEALERAVPSLHGSQPRRVRQGLQGSGRPFRAELRQGLSAVFCRRASSPPVIPPLCHGRCVSCTLLHGVAPPAVANAAH